MGNLNLNSFSSLRRNIKQEYQFLQRYDDERFGEVSIYGSRFQRNEFVAEYTVSVQHQRVQFVEGSIRAFQQAYQSHNEQFPYLRIVHYSISYHDMGLGNQLTKSCTIPQISIWVEYLRHNLNQFLTWRVKEDRPLLLDEIRMAMMKALRATRLLRKNQNIGVSLNTEDISITIDGEMKFHPLMGRVFQDNIIGRNARLAERNSLKRRFTNKPALNKHQHQHHQSSLNNINNNYHNSKLNSLNLTRELSIINPSQSQSPSSDMELLYQLKKFVNKLILQGSYGKYNPEDNNQYSSQAKEMRLFLEAINKARSLKELNKIAGNTSVNCFMVNFSKLKHQQSQTRFEKLLSDLESKSQRTNYTTASFSPNKPEHKAYFPISSQQYRYY